MAVAEVSICNKMLKNLLEITVTLYSDIVLDVLILPEGGSAEIVASCHHFHLKNAYLEELLENCILYSFKRAHV
jgi:hypothetical protein